jgi:NADPH2:quinone reductase
MQQVSLPEDMAAVEITEPGPPDVLSVARRPVPTPASGEVLIEVAAAGVNRPDCLQRLGLYPPPPDASDLPGLEVAGTVVAVADTVESPRVGDAVCALVSGGGYAEFCVAPAVQCLPIPRGFDFIQAAALPETFFTVWTNVFERGRLTAGESILIHGGASGIGTTAIQMARSFGARVFTTVGNPEKRRLCEQLGAERAIEYRREQFLDVIKELTDGRGVDLILDIVGAKYLGDNIKSLNTDGRLVIIGSLGGREAELNLGRILFKRLTVTGSTLRARSTADKGKIASALLENIWPKLESGEIAPVIQSTYPLAEAAKAHAFMEANQSMGKLILTNGQ